MSSEESDSEQMIEVDEVTVEVDRQYRLADGGEDEAFLTARGPQANLLSDQARHRVKRAVLNEYGVDNAQELDSEISTNWRDDKVHVATVELQSQTVSKVIPRCSVDTASDRSGGEADG